MYKLLLVVVLFYGILFAKEPQNVKQTQSPQKLLGTPNATLLNINNFSAWYSDNSEMEREPGSGNSGLTFPRSTATAIYTSGLIYGGMLNDNGVKTLKVNGFSYRAGFQRGAILGIRTGIIENPDNPEVRIWRIRKDYATADLAKDAAEFLLKPLSAVNQTDINQLRAQYKKDWQVWPASKGAPFYDKNNNGIYDPKFIVIGGIEVPDTSSDSPGLANADQVLWYVANDIGAFESPWKSTPVGMEQQVTIWGYNRTGTLGNIAFKKIKLIFKGTATLTANAKIENMYLTHWSDPDLGNASDDFVGCDTILSLGYVYNAKTIDNEYVKFNLPPPAIGYDFLQGPIVASANDTAVFDLKYRTGYKNLPMTSFIYFASGGFYSDPPFSAIGSIQWYQMMRGLPPTPTGPPDPLPLKNPNTGLPSSYWLSGDPVTGTGWVDGILEGPGDRRMLQTSGAFTMAIGDTQEIVVGVVGGVGEDRLSSIVEMRSNDRSVQFSYDNLFKIIPPDYTIDVTDLSSSDAKIIVSSTSSVGQFKSITAILKRQNGTTIKQITLFDDGTHGDGIANDGIFANSATITKESSPAYLSSILVDMNNKTQQFEKIKEFITIAGSVAISANPVFYDSYNTDGQLNKGEYVRYGVTFQNSTMFDLSGITVRPLADYEGHGGIQISSLTALNSSAMSYNALDFNSYFSLRVPFNFVGTVYSIPMVITDNKNNLWRITISFPVSNQVFKRDTLYNMATNIVGNNDAVVGYVANNPAYSGTVYDIWFGKNQTNTSWTLVKSIPGNDYATQFAVLSSLNPSAKGTGTFTIDDAKASINYSITVQGLTGAITSANIYAGEIGKVGKLIKPLTFVSGVAQGVWSKSDAANPLTDSLVTEFIAGRLYINGATAANPSGEVRGQIDYGVIPRQYLNIITGSGSPNPINPGNYEYTMNGFSLYVSAPYVGIKSIIQQQPTVGDVRYIINPEKTYYIGTISGGGGSKQNEADITFRFNNEINYAGIFPPIGSPTPLNLFFIKIPFAVYKDTVRVWPIIKNSRYTDSLWNTDSTLRVGQNQYPTFDMIAGIVDVIDGADNNLTYYSPTNTTFPPTSNAVKGRLINGVNHIASDIFFVNVKGDGIPPAVGTKILFSPSKSIKNGDIKRFTLQVLKVQRDDGLMVPQQYSLEQNYPNPFNPTTAIKFALPVSGNVVLKIFDLLGREVTTLINENLKAGNYTANFDASRFASGVYFYRIEAHQKEGGQAGNFVQAKKMLLLK